MFEFRKNAEAERLIAMTKSDSGVCGPTLVQAHFRLGELLGQQMSFPAEDTTVVAVLRGGIFFAMGIYMALGCKFDFYDPKQGVFERPATKHVILVDSVINTGKTISAILDKDMFVACCVVNEAAMHKFSERLYAIRVSDNSFVGANVDKQIGTMGPDTTMRLFNTISK